MSHSHPDLSIQADNPDGMFIIGTRDSASQRTRQRRSIALGAGLSLLIHALLLGLTMNSRLDTSISPGGHIQQPITVRLAQQAAPVTTLPSPPGPPKSHVTQPRRKIIRLPKRNTPKQPTPQPMPLPEPPRARAQEVEPPMDMSAMIAAARERRQRASAAMENAEAAAASRGPSANDIAMANIQRSLQGKHDGIGGVFQILHKGVRTGTFVFRGWTPGARNTTQQTIEVDAGLNGDIEHAMVRRMIELIRTHYTGDFSWESHRLGRVLVKSARMEDSAELEAFLMKEFFDG